MKTKASKTTDAVKILHRRYYEGKPRRMAMLKQARLNDAVARQKQDLRKKASRRDLTIKPRARRA